MRNIVFPNFVSFCSKYQSLQDIFFSNYDEYKKKIAHFKWCTHNKATKKQDVHGCEIQGKDFLPLILYLKQ